MVHRHVGEHCGLDSAQAKQARPFEDDRVGMDPELNVESDQFFNLLGDETKVSVTRNKVPEFGSLERSTIVRIAILPEGGWEISRTDATFLAQHLHVLVAWRKTD